VVAGGSLAGRRVVATSIQGGDGSAQVAGPYPSQLAVPILAGMAGGYTSRAFIGRAEELRRLAATLDRAEQDQPQLVLLAGDAGMGKTRLLLEFADRAQQRGSRVLAGGCVELGDIGLAYLPVTDALRGLVDDPEETELVAEVAVTAPGLGRLLPEVARTGPTGALAGDGLEQLQVFDAGRPLSDGATDAHPVAPSAFQQAAKPSPRRCAGLPGSFGQVAAGPGSRLKAARAQR
jgi:hypothetical protein